MPEETPFFMIAEQPHDDWLYQYRAIGLSSTGANGWDFNNGYFLLWEDGCWVDGVRNCTAMCSDTTKIWGQDPKLNLSVIANVANCAIYPIIANMLAHERHNLSDPYELIGPDNAIAKYGIQPAGSVDLAKINETTGSCMAQYCAAKGTDCGVQKEYPADEYDFYWYQGSWYDFRSGNVSTIVPDYSSLCYSVDGELNGDIGGIGVIIAYLMTASILMLLYLSIRLSKNVIKYILIPYIWGKHKTAGPVKPVDNQGPWPIARARSFQVQDKVYKSHHSFNLIATIAEFQKGQCIFWLAISAAVLIGLAGSTQTVGSHTIADFNNNITVLQIVCSCAFFYTSFGLYCLWVARKRSMYIILMSLVTMILSGSGWAATKYASAKDVAVDDEVSQFTACGAITPKSYCDQGIGTDGYLINLLHDTHLDVVSVVLGSIVMIFILIDWAFHKNARLRETKIGKWFCLCDQREVPWWRSYTPAVLLFLFECTYIIIWAFTYVTFVWLAQIANMRDWGFGQVIAVTVWLPVFLEYIHGNFEGVEKVLEYRIPEGYQIIDGVEGRQSVFQTERDVSLDQETRSMEAGGPKQHAYATVESQSQEELPHWNARSS